MSMRFIAAASAATAALFVAAQAGAVTFAYTPGSSVAGVGFSPPTRVFEAAGAGVCLVTDQWTGIETFFEPEKEILVAGSAEEIVTCLRNISAARAHEIGENMRERALRDHTYALRAREVDAIIANVPVGVAALSE